MATFKLQDENKDKSRQILYIFYNVWLVQFRQLRSSPIRLEPNDVARQNFIDQRSILKDEDSVCWV